MTHDRPGHVAGAPAVPPAVQMVQMLAGFRVSQAPVSVITARA